MIGLFKQRMIYLKIIKHFQTHQLQNRLIGTTSTKFCSFGFSKEESSYILEKINSMNKDVSKLIGEGNKKKLNNYLQSNELKTLDDLLKVHGLGPKSIKRICDKILNEELESSPLEKGQKRIKPLVIVPSLTDREIESTKTIVALHIGNNEVSWAGINAISKTIDSWDLFSLDTVFPAKKKPDLIAIIDIVKEFVSQLPESDVVVLEDLTSGFGSTVSGPSTKQLMTAISATLLHSSCGEGPKLMLVGGRVVAQWSGRLVGAEKVSSQSVVGEVVMGLVSSTVPSPGGAVHLTTLSASPQLRASYLARQSLQREALAEALLIAISFMDIAIFKRQPIFKQTKS